MQPQVLPIDYPGLLKLLDEHAAIAHGHLLQDHWEIRVSVDGVQRTYAVGPSDPEWAAFQANVLPRLHTAAEDYVDNRTIAGELFGLSEALGTPADAIAAGAEASLIALVKRQNLLMEDLRGILTSTKAHAKFMTFYANPAGILTPATPKAAWEWHHVRRMPVPGKPGEVWVPRMFSGMSNMIEDHIFRLCEETPLGTWTNNNAFTPGQSSVDPDTEHWSDVEAISMVAMSVQVTLTVTYTNEKGQAGRTTQVTIPAGGPYRVMQIPLAEGDIGMLSVQNVTAPGGIATGSVTLYGHKTAAATMVIRSGSQGFAPVPPVPIEGVAFRPGRIIGFEYAAASTTTANVFAFASGNIQKEY